VGRARCMREEEEREVIWYGQCMIKYMIFHDLLVKVQLDHGGKKL
jgi:hypothetical protein